MNNPKDILALLGIPSEKVANFDYYDGTDGHSRIILELIDERQKCPNCNSSHVRIHGYYNVTINNSIIRAHNTYIDIRMRRYRCYDCGKTFKQTFPLYLPYKRISRAAEISIKEDLKECVSYSYIAKQYDVSTNTVINIFDSLPRMPREKLTKCICVDEFHFSNSKNKHCKYPFVISDPFNARILEIIESRRWDYLRSYFVNLSLNERKCVQFFVSDMHETYRKLRKAFFPNALHIIDHFHIIRAFTNAIQKIRIRVMKQQEDHSKEYGFLKKNWKMFLMKRINLKSIRKINKNTGEVFDFEILLDNTLRKYPDLFEIYWDLENFRKKLIRVHYWSESHALISFFKENFLKSSVPEIREIGRTFSNWFDEIVNSYAKSTIGFCLTNAVAEANNNTIQTLIDVGYGYGNFQRLRNRVLYINRSKKTNPD